MRQLLLTLVAALVVLNVSGARYFVSSSGDDANGGRRPADAWRTVAHVNQSMKLFKPGDSILFRSGDVFEGSLVVSTSGSARLPLYIGSYGSGLKPLITGAKQFSSWTREKTNIWFTTLDTPPSELKVITIDGVPLAPGRHPNTGYRTSHCTNGCQETLVDTLLKSPANYWKGADIVVRSERWIIDRVGIASHSGSELQLKTAPTYKVPNGAGYFFTNHLATLDKEGEWYYDQGAKRLYVYSKSSPTSAKVLAAMADYGFIMKNISFVTLENIRFDHYLLAGGHVESTQHVMLNKLQVSNSSRNGINVANSQAPWITNCTIEGAMNNAVVWQNVKQGNFSYNQILQTGMWPGFGENGDGTYIGLSLLDGEDNTVYQNRIGKTGYIGIDFRSANSTVGNNRIADFCMLKDDGGGIYTWKTNRGGNIIENNIISGGKGNGDGAPDAHRAYASGIYIDDLSSGIVVRNNSISRCALAGIFIHNATQITVADNKLWGNGYHPGNRDKGQLYIRYDDIVQWPDAFSARLRVRGNTMTAVSEDSYCMFLRTKSSDNVRRLGLFNDNTFAAPRTGQAVASVIGGGESCIQSTHIALDTWQFDTSHEEGSTFGRIAAPTPQSDNLVANSTMNSTSGWIVWPEGAVLRKVSDQLSGSALEVTPENNKGEALLYHAGVQLKASTYRLSFIARSDERSEIGFSMLMADSPWATVSEYVCFSTERSYQSYTFYFTPYPSASGRELRLNFKSHAAFSIDNVMLVEMGDAELREVAAKE